MIIGKFWLDIKKKKKDAEYGGQRGFYTLAIY